MHGLNQCIWKRICNFDAYTQGRVNLCKSSFIVLLIYSYCVSTTRSGLDRNMDDEFLNVVDNCTLRINLVNRISYCSIFIMSEFVLNQRERYLARRTGVLVKLKSRSINTQM